MQQKYWKGVPDAALHRADNFLLHNSDPRNEASESPYRSNLPLSLGAWTEDHLLLCIRRWAPRARWLLLDRDIYGPGFSLAHQLFPGANSQRLTDVNACGSSLAQLPGHGGALHEAVLGVVVYTLLVRQR